MRDNHYHQVHHLEHNYIWLRFVQLRTLHSPYDKGKETGPKPFTCSGIDGRFCSLWILIMKKGWMKSIIDAVLNRLIGELFICVGKGSGSEGHHQGCQRTIMSHGNFLRILSLFLSTAAFVTGSLPRPLSSLAIVAQPIVASCCRRFCQHLSASTAVASVAG